MILKTVGQFFLLVLIVKFPGMLDLSLCFFEVLNRNGATSSYVFLLVLQVSVY